MNEILCLHGGPTCKQEDPGSSYFTSITKKKHYSTYYFAITSIITLHNGDTYIPSTSRIGMTLSIH
ncbi:hypothetical protein MKX03_030157 [Papaver bracteatum]|nr:hypothetical protein MKX03_030157 [Papaver bracteatum]